MTQNSKRIAVILSVLILVIGFAAVTTTLVLNGGLLVGEADDFKIIFTEAILDGRKDNSLISNDKKTITFESKELLDLNDKTTLEYMVANTSRNYDANVSVNCSISSDTNEYVYIRNNPSEMIVEAGTSKKGTIEVELIKVLTESKEVSLTCELVSTPIERDNLAIPYNYNVMIDSELVTELDAYKHIYITHRVGSFWDYKFDITKIVFENKMQAHETLDELIFDVSVNQDKSVMSYLVKNEGDSSKYTLYIQADGKIYAPKDCSYLFFSFFNLESIDGLEYFDTSNVTNMSNMFGWCEKLQVIDVSNFDTSEVVNMSGMFDVYESDYSPNPLLSNIIGLESFDTNNVIAMNGMFSGCSNLTNLDVSNFDTSNVTEMSGMFFNCVSLTSLDVSNFDTSNVSSMSSMFANCSNLTSLDLSKFDTSNVTAMSLMFNNCGSLTNLHVSNFDTSNVTEMSGMFFNCVSLTSLDVSNFDTSNVSSMSSMFANCSNLTSLDLSKFDTSNVTKMFSMFKNCANLEYLDISNFDVSKVTDLSDLFAGCINLTDLNISSFDLSNVIHMSGMFVNSPKISTVITINSNNCTDYKKDYSNSFGMFEGAATEEGAKIVVNFTSLDYLALVEDMVNTKSANSNIVINGEFPKYSVTITENDDIVTSKQESYATSYIKLSSKSGNNIVTSFKLNGNLVEASDFVMPEEDVVISDIVTSEGIVIESEHYPYPDKISKVYGEKTFEGATSITVNLYYQTYDSYDKIYVYHTQNDRYTYYGKDGFNPKKETINIDGNYVKILFATDYFDNSYYGFRAEIIPHYE